MDDKQDTITLAISGASGAAYGLRLLQCLLEAQRRVYLLISPAAHVVIAQETDLKLPGRAEDMRRTLADHYQVEAAQLLVFGREQWTAPIASGSNTARAMVICPCSSATLAAVANGSSSDLIERAADVMLKEQRQLILVPRETPLSAIHLENMLKLARLGVSIMPASPGFYQRPESVEALVDFMVARVLDHLDIDHHLLPRWGEEPA
jgi:4-hydroxy-3-polyprenylbenzoate decarboxylase